MKCPAQRNAPRPQPAQCRHHTQPHYKARGKQSYFSCISRLFAIFRSILIFEFSSQLVTLTLTLLLSTDFQEMHQKDQHDHSHPITSPPSPGVGQPFLSAYKGSNELRSSTLAQGTCWGHAAQLQAKQQSSASCVHIDQK